MGIVLSILLSIGLLGFCGKLIWGRLQNIKQQRIDFADILKQRRANFPQSIKASAHFINQPKQISENLEDFAA